MVLLLKLEMVALEFLRQSLVHLWLAVVVVAVERKVPHKV
jgi:hypothetical protein